MRRFLAISLLLSTTACFDSDELGSDFELPETTTQGPKPHPPVYETGEDDEGPPPPDLGDPETTCNDAVGCILDCAVELQMEGNLEEVDLSCFFDCEEGLTVDEALKLVELGACVFNFCTDEGNCEATPENPLAPLDPDGTCVFCIAAGIDGGFADACVSELEECD